MRSKKIAAVLMVLMLYLVPANAEESTNQKSGITNIITNPIETIISPIIGGDLADIIMRPAKLLLLQDLEMSKLATTPGRTQEYIYNINKNVTVITQEDILETNPRNIQEIIFHAAGIVISGYKGNAKDNNIDMRGFGEAGPQNVLVLIDGRRINQIDLSAADMSQIDINSIERIEIIRGSNSVLYGDNASGGVINIITKRGETGDHVEYIQEFGSYQYHKEYVSASGASDFIDYFLSYSNQDSEGYRLNNNYESDDMLANLTVKPDDSFDVAFTASYHKDWQGDPGALYDANIQGDGREASRFPNDRFKSEDYYFAIDPRIYLKGNDTESILSGFMSYRSRRSNAVSRGSTDYETNHHIASVDFRPKYEIKSDLFDGAAENKLVLGADYFYSKDQILSGDITLTKSQLDITKETLGLYAADNMLINGRFIVGGGIRGEWAEYSFDQDQPLVSYDTSSLREAAFDIGLGYKYNEKSQVYVNSARSYRYPNTEEFFTSAYESSWFGATSQVAAVLNTNLKQQVGNNFEIGIKDNSFDPIDVNVSYYFLDNKNEIYYDPVSYQNENYHNTIHHGLEMETEMRIIEDKIKIFFNYSYQEAYFKDGKYDGNDIPLVPRNKISSGLNIKPIEPLNLNFTVNYVGPRRITSDQDNNSSPLKPYTTCDAGFSYKIDNIRFFGSIKNLFNEKYFSNATRNWQGNTAFYPAPERTFEVGMAVKF